MMKNIVSFKKKVASKKLIAALFVGAALPALAHQAIIDERRDGFNEMGGVMKVYRNEIQQGGGDLAAVAEASDKLAALADKIPTWFPEGSGPESKLDTDARAYIWENKQKFDDLTKALMAESRKMAELARAGDKDAVKKQMVVIRDNCSGCHDSFRVD